MTKIISLVEAIALICTIASFSIFVNARSSEDAILDEQEGRSRTIRTKVGISNYAPKDATRSFPNLRHMKETTGSTKDDKICVVHVGPHKTGSSTLQSFFLSPHSRQTREALKQDNYEFPIFPNQKWNAKNHADFANCLRPMGPQNKRCRNERYKSDTFEYFQSFVKNAAENGSNIILSAEKLDYEDVNIAELASFLVPEYKIHVVLYYRRFYDWSHSLYNQEEKRNDIDKPTFVEWLQNATSIQAMYSMAVYNRYQEVPGIFNVSVVNMHEDPDNFNTYERFSCNHLDQAPHVCELAKSQEMTLHNPSVDMDWDLFRARIQQYHSIKLSEEDERWPQILQKFNEMTDFPKHCLSTEWKDKLLRTSLEAEIALTPKWWQNSDEGLKNLKSDFEEKSKSKLCSLDVETILKSLEWQNFLTELEEDEAEEES